MDQNIKGFNELSTYAQRLFKETNQKHLEAVEDKASWTPIKVKEHQNHIGVHFKNGTWLHYLPDGTWY